MAQVVPVPLRAEEERGRLASRRVARLSAAPRGGQASILLNFASTARHVGRRVDARAVKEVLCW